jgi:ubiquinone/menaquinone biosynthesis C-methylase UbiE
VIGLNAGSRKHEERRPNLKEVVMSSTQVGRETASETSRARAVDEARGRRQKRLPKAPDRILEQASGTGILTCEIAQLFPECRVIGVELHDGYLSIARTKVRDLGLTNVEFIHGRAEDVVLEGEFECIVSDYLAKYVDLDLLVTHVRVMLRKDGLFILHELRPTHPFFLALWNAHFKFLRAYGNWRYPEFRPFLEGPDGWMD